MILTKSKVDDEPCCCSSSTEHSCDICEYCVDGRCVKSRTDEIDSNHQFGVLTSKSSSVRR